ncbi:MAG: class I SAM-dependent methyltransferase [Actinomycetota bacterium]
MDARDWDERYRDSELLWSREPNRFVAEELSALEPGTALDVACGEGRNSVWLAGLGWQVTGVDFSAVALGKAEAMADEQGVAVEWVRADILSWDPGRTFDLVLVAYVHLPPPEREALMEKVVSWVAPGGHLLVVGHDAETLGVSGPPSPELLWTPDLATELAAPLRVMDARRRVRETEEGVSAVDTVLMAEKPR